MTNVSTQLAHVVVDELIRCGVREAVLTPGSRSAPLAFALQAADTAGRLRLHVRIDERTAAFLALGLAKLSRRAVPVVTTSGTAAANLYPAILEADASGVALLALTADRPPELRATGASQTVDQIKLYGDAVRLFHEMGTPTPTGNPYWRSVIDRAVAAATGAISGDPGPAHVNLAFADPLVPESLDDLSPPGRADGRPWTAVAELGAHRSAPPADDWPEHTVVIVGDAKPDIGAAALSLAEAHGWPVIAEPSSGARSGPNALQLGHLLLENDQWLSIHQPARVLVVGRPTLHRTVGALLKRNGVETMVVSRSPRWPDSTRSASLVLTDLPTPGRTNPGPGNWLAAWTAADQAAVAARAVVLGEMPFSESAVAAAVLSGLPAGALLIAGSSMPVRELASAPVRDGVSVISNRGVAGIDGTVSTALGAALSWQRDGGGPAFALIGDLTFLHDSNGLLGGPDEPRPDLTIVVVNNDGGAIFGLLEQGAPQYAPAYERVFGTAQGVDLAALCAATATPYERITNLAELTLGQSNRGVRVVEVRTDRRPARALSRAISAAIATAL